MFFDCLSCVRWLEYFTMSRKPLCLLLLLIAAAFLAFGTPGLGQVPYDFHFVSTREGASNVLYDPFHQRFYVTVPLENSVYVVNEADGTVTQKISVPSAFGLDLSVDGTRLYVTSSVTILGYPAAEGYFVVDTGTLHVIDFVQPTIIIPSVGFVPSYNVDDVPRFIAALSNGKIAYTANEIGTTGGSIFLNDPATNLASNIVSSDFYDGAISKALNGSAFVAVSGDSAGEAIAVYDTASNTYTANKYLTTVNSDVIISPDGSQILAGGHLLLDRNLNQIADLRTPLRNLGLRVVFQWLHLQQRRLPNLRPIDACNGRHKSRRHNLIFQSRPQGLQLFDAPVAWLHSTAGQHSWPYSPVHRRWQLGQGNSGLRHGRVSRVERKRAEPQSPSRSLSVAQFSEHDQPTSRRRRKPSSYHRQRRGIQDRRHCFLRAKPGQCHGSLPERHQRTAASLFAWSSSHHRRLP